MEAPTCTICLEDVKKGEVSDSYFCSNNHLYHSPCAWSWLTKQLDGYNPSVDNKRWVCPTCRHIPTSRKQLDRLLTENKKVEDWDRYKKKFDKAYPPSLLQSLLQDFDSKKLLILSLTIVKTLFVAAEVISYLVIFTAYKICCVAHKCFSYALSTDQEKLFIYELYFVFLTLIFVSALTQG